MAPYTVLAAREILFLHVRCADGRKLTRYPHNQTGSVSEALADIMGREGYGEDDYTVTSADEDSTDGWDQIVIRATGEVFGWCDSGVYDADAPLNEVHPRADRLVSPEELRRAA